MTGVPTMLIEIAVLFAFVLTATAVVVSPGPDTVVILRHALSSGRLTGLAAVAGVQFGLVIHTILAALGISALIAASPMLFKGVALAGALYLAWLGIRSLTARGGLMFADLALPATLWGAGREAMFTNLLNPKVLVLFLALYPNFVTTGRGSVALQIGLLSGVLITVNVVWQVGLVWSADRARRWLGRPAVGGVIRLGVGTALSTFALILLVERVF